ncbi:MAG TPA: ABC transporter permease [Candidatus Competibacteraceae bacterium]|nr:ABC transporter permease [Candidatus Competibacteraceae bacterium]
MFNLYGYGPSILEGSWLTVKVALLSLLLAVVLGMVGALAKLSASRSARLVAGVYTTVIRGVPDLVLMLLIFFGGQMLVNDLSTALGYETAPDIDPFTAGALTLGFIYGAYMLETFRGAILSVPAGQLEAGYAYGMRKHQVFFRILLPQMIRHALPGFGNNWLVLLKSTALVSVIGLDDMVRRAGIAGRATQKSFTFYLVAALGFLVFTTISIILLRWAEKRYSLGFAPRTH